MVILASVGEAEYRQSRLCRLLENPIAFTVVSLLAEGKEMNTTRLWRIFKSAETTFEAMIM
jgi:hypothetical protein